MPTYAKHFTLPRRGQPCPTLRRRLLRIRELLAEARRAQEREGGRQIVILRGNGKGPILSGAGKREKEEAQRLIEEIAAEGIQIKDLERGLVDFPHFLNGDPSREVFLCWHLGEDTIDYWHEIEDGIAGRRPL